MAAGRVAAGRSTGLAAMPKYYEDKEEDGRACSGVREDLRQCLLESPCVLQVSAPALRGWRPAGRPFTASCLQQFRGLQLQRRAQVTVPSEIAGEVL